MTLGLLAAGARVAATELDAEALDETGRAAEDAGADDRILDIVADVTRDDSAPKIVRAAVDRFGRLDILINNAMVGHYCDLWEEAESQYDATLDVNLKGYFALIRYAAVPMGKQGGGAIVNTSSASGG